LVLHGGTESKSSSKARAAIATTGEKDERQLGLDRYGGRDAGSGYYGTRRKVMRWFWQKKPEVFLTPGTCQCSHDRCHHIDGKGKCRVEYPPCEDHPKEWISCACQVYIRDDRNGGEQVDPTPSPADLEKIYQL
jgi:hypothetical protein